MGKVKESFLAPGAVYDTNNFGKIYVVNFMGYKTIGGKKCQMYKIHFANTNHEMVTSRDNITRGTIADRFAPTVYGIGYLGDAKPIVDGTLQARGKSVWENMIRRCVNEEHKSWNTYGGAGIRIDPRWYNLDNFLGDIPWLPGFDEWVKNPDWQLDKDIKQKNLPKSERMYSRDTCIFVSPLQNGNNREIKPNTTFGYGVHQDNDAYAFTTYRCRFTHNGVKYDYGRYTDKESAQAVADWYGKPLGKPMNHPNIDISEALKHKVTRRPMVEDMVKIVEK